MIFIDNRQNKVEVTEEFEDIVKKVIQHALIVEKVEVPCEVSVISVSYTHLRAHET